MEEILKKTAIWDFILKQIDEDKNVLLIIVAQTRGNAPGKTGAKMAVTTDGYTFGTIGGGKVENDLKLLTLELYHKEAALPLAINYAYNSTASEEPDGMICGGEQTFLIFKLAQSHKEQIVSIADCISKHHRMRISWLKTGKINLESCEKDHPKKAIFSIEGKVWQYSEILCSEPLIHIIGGGHVSLALSRIMHTLGYYIRVYCERPHAPSLLANHFADEIRIVSFERIREFIQLSGNDYLILMTPSHRSDEIVLQNILTLPAKFIGLMASPQKNLLFQKNLAKAGFDENLRAKIHSPIGLPINSHTPEEIAISIAAQIIGIHNS